VTARSLTISQPLDAYNPGLGRGRSRAGESYENDLQLYQFVTFFVSNCNG